MCHRFDDSPYGQDLPDQHLNTPRPQRQLNIWIKAQHFLKMTSHQPPSASAEPENTTTTEEGFPLLGSGVEKVYIGSLIPEE